MKLILTSLDHEQMLDLPLLLWQYSKSIYYRYKILSDADHSFLESDFCFIEFKWILGTLDLMQA